MAEIHVLSPCSMIGSVFSESSIEHGPSLMPHVILCGGGSAIMSSPRPGPGRLTVDIMFEEEDTHRRVIGSSARD